MFLENRNLNLEIANNCHAGTCLHISHITGNWWEVGKSYNNSLEME